MFCGKKDVYSTKSKLSKRIFFKEHCYPTGIDGLMSLPLLNAHPLASETRCLPLSMN